MTTIRVQRKRTKGWKMPPNTIYVGRPTKWGNPYHLTNGRTVNLLPGTYKYGEEGSTLSDVVENFRTYADARLKREPSWLNPLQGKNLACWCPLNQPCHADILKEIIAHMVTHK